MFLFLQGPISPFFSELGAALRGAGHTVHRVNLCLGDKLFWRIGGAVDYRGKPEDWPGWIDRFLAEERVTDIVLLGERRDYHRAAIAAAAARGIAVTVTDFGYLRPDWITLERDGMAGGSRFPRDPAAIRAVAAGLPVPDLSARYRDSFATQATWDMIYHFATMLPWPFRHYRSHQLLHPLVMYAGTSRRVWLKRWENARTAETLARLAQNRTPYWLFAMQMETDFSIRAYSPYPDLDTPIRETVRSFAAHAPAAAHLLVKVHPLDPCVKNWRRRIARIAEAAGIPGRVHYLPGGVLDQILYGAKGLVTVNSTAGMHALQLDVPLKVLGDAVYDVPGLAFQGPLDRFWSAGRQPDPTLRDDFLTAMTATIQIRGVYYNRVGLDAAVAAAAERLSAGLINLPLPRERHFPADPAQS